MSRRWTEAVCLVFLGLLGACEGAPLTDPSSPGLEAPGTDPQSISDSWTKKRPLSPNRYDMVAGAINGIIYVVGGIHTDWTTMRAFPLSRVDAYNIGTNAWSRVASLPGPRLQANGASAINGKLYVSGGFYYTADANQKATKTLFVYSPGTNTWARKADMPEAGCAGAQGVIAGKLYVYMPSLQGCDPFASGTVVRFYRYNPATDTWAKRALPPVPGRTGAGGVIDGKFYLAGQDSRLYVYDPVSNIWQTRASMSQERTLMVGAVVNGRLYMVGGHDGWSDGRTPPRLEVYNPVTNSWAPKTPLPFGTTNGAAVGAMGKVYYLPGRIFPTSGAWETLPDVSDIYVYTP